MPYHTARDEKPKQNSAALLGWGGKVQILEKPGQLEFTEQSTGQEGAPEICNGVTWVSG